MWGEKAKNAETAPRCQQKVGRKSEKCRNRPTMPTKSGSKGQKMQKPPRGANKKWVEKVKNAETAPRCQQKVGRKSEKCRNRPTVPTQAVCDVRKIQMTIEGTAGENSSAVNP
jgi:hypothetical protein